MTAAAAELRPQVSDAGLGAFTLVELLVVIAVVAVLIGLALPAISGSRRRARAVQSLSNVRQLCVVHGLYSEDYRGLCVGVYDGQLYPIGMDAAASSTHWQVDEDWPGVVYTYLPFDANRGVFRSPGSRHAADADVRSDYAYSLSFVGRPALWDPTHTPEASDAAVQRRDAVQFPSSKVMLWDRIVAYLPEPPATIGPDLAVQVATGFADGSARECIPAQAAAPVVNRLLPSGEGAATARLHNTPLGIAGRDFP